jgi:hypothetical protein
MNDPIQIAVAVLIGVSSLGVFTVAGAFAWGLIRRFERPKPVMGDAEATRLRQAVEQLAGEVSELHERLDFAERVLAAGREGDRLEGERP